MADIRLERVSKVYPGEVRAVDAIDLEIRDGEFMILLGPSGCGKSTTLRLIAGLEAATAGDLYLGDQRINEVDPKDRNLAIVFQNYALFPHMTVAGNLGFGMRIRGRGRAETERRVREVAEMLGIGELLARKPRELSGGQRQRVALGRALIRDPVAFLLDEPLSNLDAKLRASMRTELIKLHRQLGRTVIHVTHDQVEAMTMGERICIMNRGRIVQIGRPMAVYRNPADVFVAGFLASPPMNLLEARLQADGAGGGLTVVSRGLSLPLSELDAAAFAAYRDRPVILGIRPEDLREQPGDGALPLELRVVTVEALGPEVILIASLPDGVEIAGRMGRDFTAPIGSAQRVYLDPGAIHLFDPETTKAIPRPTRPVEQAQGAFPAMRGVDAAHAVHQG
jgi:multiple sugar transport system ATP-binding protein